MRKLLLFFLILISSISTCFATTYKSNILMQKLSDDSDSEYYLVVEENKESLFDVNGNIVKERTVNISDSFDNKYITICIKDYINNSIETSSYNNDLLVSYEFCLNGESTVIRYNYDDNGTLIFSSYQIEQNVPIVTFYIRDAVSGQLIGTKSTDSYNWNGTNYLIDNELMLTEISSGVFLEDNFTYNENNTITYEKNGILYIYSISGLILEEKSSDYSIYYYYDDEGKCISSKSVTDNEVIESNYNNSNIINSKTYKGDVLVESTEYLSSGMIKTLYSNEKPIAEICYDKNNIKVVDIRYLN